MFDMWIGAGEASRGGAFQGRWAACVSSGRLRSLVGGVELGEEPEGNFALAVPRVSRRLLCSVPREEAGDVVSAKQ